MSGSIRKITISNYGCVKDMSFSLSPLHALVGPNDSGKSTILRGIRTLMQQASTGFWRDDGEVMPFDPWLLGDSKPGKSTLCVSTKDGFHYELDISANSKMKEKLAHESLDYCPLDADVRLGAAPPISGPGRSISGREGPEYYNRFMSQISGPTLVRFDPDALRAPSPLIPDAEGIAFADERGTGLASVFDAITNRDYDAIVRIQGEVQRLFPSVAKVGLINVSSTHKTIAVTLDDGTRVGAGTMSEGLLYFLGFAALRYTDGSNVFLIEEPENGLHPARITEVMTVLRDISKQGQVILATHSPLVVNELKGHEVSIVTRTPEQGTRGILLKDVPRFEEASKVYQPGELWLTYADGHLEEPLLDGTPRT